MQKNNIDELDVELDDIELDDKKTSKKTDNFSRFVRGDFGSVYSKNAQIILGEDYEQYLKKYNSLKKKSVKK